MLSRRLFGLLLYLIFWLQYVLLAYRLISSAFNLGFEDANIPFGPVEGTELSCTYNNCYPSLNLSHVVTM